jgi:hypothetical protein
MKGIRIHSAKSVIKHKTIFSEGQGGLPI